MNRGGVYLVLCWFDWLICNVHTRLHVMSGIGLKLEGIWLVGWLGCQWLAESFWGWYDSFQWWTLIGLAYIMGCSVTLTLSGMPLALLTNLMWYEMPIVLGHFCQYVYTLSGRRILANFNMATWAIGGIISGYVLQPIYPIILFPLATWFYR